MNLKHHLLPTSENNYTPHILQKAAVIGMFLMILLSFAVSNLQALLWQSSDWLVGAVLPAVVVDLTNSERKDLNAVPLKRSSVLDEAARLKAEDMAKNSYFAHYSPAGTSPWFWFDKVSYTYAHAGENLAIHFKDSGAVVEAWMNSPSHRANIVNPNYTEIGVGTAKGTFDGYETVFVVQMFGTPAKPLPAPTTARLSTVVTENNNNLPTSTLAVAEVIAKIEESELSVLNEPEVLVSEQINLETVPEVSTESVNELSAESVYLAKAEVDEDTLVDNLNNNEVMETEIGGFGTKGIEVAEVHSGDGQTSIFSTHYSTSTGLEPIVGSVSGTTAPEVNLVGFMTRPSVVLQSLYLTLGLFVSILLLCSIVIGLNYHRPLQVVYGVGLLMLMSGLFYVHQQLTTNVVVAADSTFDQTLETF